MENNGNAAETKEGQSLLARLRWAEKGKDGTEVMCSGGGAAARGKSAQSLPPLCSAGVDDTRQPF